MTSHNSKPSSKVYAPDSSPISTTKAMSRLNASSSTSTSASRLGRAMGAGGGVGGARGGTASFGSSFTNGIQKAKTSRPASSSSSPTPSSTVRSAVPAGSISSSSSSSSRILGLDKFKYSGSGTDSSGSRNAVKSRNTPISLADDSDDSLSSVDSDRPQKKRKFKRGKPPGSPEDSPRKKPIHQSSSSSSPPRTSTPTPIEIPDSGDDVPPRVKRIYKIFEADFTLQQCLAEDKANDGDSEKTVKALTKRQQLLRAAGSKPRQIQQPVYSVSSSSAESSRLSTPATSESTHRYQHQPNGLERFRAGASTMATTQQQQQQQQPLRKAPVKREEVVLEETDSDGGWGSSDSDKQSSRRQAAAVKWFNEASVEVLVETVGCTTAQANIIAELRPFKSADDAERKLKARKGVTGKLFSDYIDILASFQTVDQILRKCEARAARLEKACSPEAVARDPLHLKKQPSNMGRDITLKDYQLEGVNWLSLRYRNETSCILADDMGTGKTCQVIAFLCDLKQRGVKGTNLVVAPSSTIENWSREMARFGPKLKLIVFAGSQAERRSLRYEIEEDHDDLDVIVTSYNSATSATDLKFFKKFGFNACIYDEGHQLKNQNTQNYRSLMQVRAKWRLLLTGTPLQNNLLELMSLLKFIMPHDFKNASEALETIFKAKNGAKDSQLSKSRVDRAKKMMLPFVLRRIKDKVLSLPPKTIQVEYCDMTHQQQKIYRKVFARTRLELLDQEGDGKGGPGKRKKDQSSNILMRLRKAAIHPMMFRTIYTEAKIAALAKDYVKEPQFMDNNMQHLREDFAINSDAELSHLAANYPATKKHQVPPEAWLNSGKIRTLQRLIKDIRSRGEKLVIFSQFEMVLFILMSALETMGVSWIAFSGSTKVEERQHVIDSFQKDPSITAFLLTTKAGGVGVNLTAANWVIMIDQDFNPQNDKQAEDRCWRIGQEREVHVIKLISRGTIDEDILALGERKLELAARVSGMENGGRKRRKSGAAAGESSLAAGEGPKAKTEGGAGDAEGGGGDGDGEGEGTATDEDPITEVDDGKMQENVAQSLMSKLRSKAQGGAGAGGKGEAGAGGMDVDDDDDDDDGEEVEILNG